MLERASELFWRLGYDVVSVQDLESATGLGRGSLYNAFGDKEGLFIAALDRYAEKFGHGAVPTLGPAQRRRRHTQDARCNRQADEQSGQPTRGLLTNTSLAFGTGSERIDKHVGAKIKAMEMLLEQAIERARHDGQIPASADARQLARFYSAVAQSLGVMHKAFGDAAALRDIVTVAMRSWPGRDETSRRGATRPRAQNQNAAIEPGARMLTPGLGSMNRNPIILCARPQKTTPLRHQQRKGNRHAAVRAALRNTRLANGEAIGARRHVGKGRQCFE